MSMSSTTASTSAVTRCPHCNAKFRVRAEQVKPHAGLVRCGACRGIFDAVEHLVEGTLPPVPPPEDDFEQEPPRTIVQGMPAVDQPHAEDAAHAAEAAAPTTRGARSGADTVARAASDVQVKNLDAPSETAAPVTPDAGDAHYRWKRTPKPLSRGARAMWALLSLLALTALVAQGAYFYRDELASRVPSLAPALAIACERVGCHLEPPRRADVLGFVGAELAADPAHKGLFVFTATLRNSGNQAVAYPHLVLSLDGLGGELVARRVFSPTEFAPATANLARGLDAGAEVEGKLYLDASQSNVVGFKVDHAYL